MGYRAESSYIRTASSLAFRSFQMHMNFTLFLITGEMALRCCELTKQLTPMCRPRIMRVVRTLVDECSIGWSAQSSTTTKIWGRGFSVLDSFSSLIFFLFVQ